MVISTVFYDNDYRRMVTNTHKTGDTIPVPVGAMFVVEFECGVPEDAQNATPGNVDGNDNTNGI